MPEDSSDGTIRQWQWLNATELAACDRDRTVVYVTCSPLEVHGPHLPLIADIFEAESLASQTFARLTSRHPEMRVLTLPPLFVAADVLPHVGSLAFRPATLVRVLTDLGRTLSRQGFRHLWVGNFHGGPRHWVAIEKACAIGNRRFGLRAVSIFSLLINRLTSGSLSMTEVFGDIEGLSDEVLDGDAHAGVIETSILLHLVPDRVAAGWRSLPRRTLNSALAEAGKRPVGHGSETSLLDVARWLTLSLKYYARETYQGAPAASSAEIGARLLERLADHSAAGLADLWTGQITPKDAHTPLYKLRFLLLNDWTRRLVERAIGMKPVV